MPGHAGRVVVGEGCERCGDEKGVFIPRRDRIGEVNHEGSCQHIICSSSQRWYQKNTNNAATTMMTMQGTGVSEDGGIAGKGTAAPGEQARCLKKASVGLAWAGVGLINVGRPMDRMDQVVVWVYVTSETWL
jgi:hypothetical protein